MACVSDTVFDAQNETPGFVLAKYFVDTPSPRGGDKRSLYVDRLSRRLPMGLSILSRTRALCHALPDPISTGIMVHSPSMHWTQPLNDMTSYTQISSRWVAYSDQRDSCTERGPGEMNGRKALVSTIATIRPSLGSHQRSRFQERALSTY